MDPWKIDEKNFPKDGTARDKMMFLLRYSILAPSTHNTQPWKFHIENSKIQVFADKKRWLKIADSEQRELHISVGCALENLLTAADYFGYDANVAYFPEEKREDLVVEVSFSVSKKTKIPNAIFNAITKRHTNHKVYDNRKISKEHVKRLESCCMVEGVRIDLTDDNNIKIKAEELYTQGILANFADAEYRQELAYWVGEGVFGTPWLISQLARLAVSRATYGKSRAEKGSKALLSASHLGLISSKTDNRLLWVKTGQAFERVALTATSLDIRIQIGSDICQIPELRKKLQALIPEMEEIPQLPLRLGYAEPDKHTPRRPLEDVLI
jgi:hypothetical protein